MKKSKKYNATEKYFIKKEKRIKKELQITEENKRILNLKNLELNNENFKLKDENNFLKSVNNVIVKLCDCNSDDFKQIIELLEKFNMLDFLNINNSFINIQSMIKLLTKSLHKDNLIENPVSINNTKTEIFTYETLYKIIEDYYKEDYSEKDIYNKLNNLDIVLIYKNSNYDFKNFMNLIDYLFKRE